MTGLAGLAEMTNHQNKPMAWTVSSQAGPAIADALLLPDSESPAEAAMASVGLCGRTLLHSGLMGLESLSFIYPDSIMIKDSWVQTGLYRAQHILSPALALPRADCGLDNLLAELAVKIVGPAAMENKNQIAIDLSQRIAGGDRSAESELVSQYGGGLMIMLQQRTGDPQLASDLYQETFIIVIKRLRRANLDEPEKLSAFLHATAKNVLIGDVRKEARRKTFANSDIVAAAPDGRPGPSDQVNRSEEAGIVRELIDEMRSKRDKALLLRFYINEEDKSDICAALNLSSIHFNRVLFRARRRFKDLLTRYENDNDERIRG